MLRIILLGAAAGGGVPQWNCNCPQCRAARATPGLQRTQASLAVSADGANWFLINASPDLRQQVNATPQLQPQGHGLRHSPIAGVILTNGEVDAVAGLLNLREKAALSVYAHARVLDILDRNPIFEVLDRKLVGRVPIAIGEALEPKLPDGKPSGLEITAFTVPGKAPLYLESSDPIAVTDGETIGLEIRAAGSDQRCHVVTACADAQPELLDRLSGSSLVFFDGTLWRDDELITAGLGSKTGARMGHLSMGGGAGTMAAFAGITPKRKSFIHINNSNPVLIPSSAEAREAAANGWIIPADGMEFSI